MFATAQSCKYQSLSGENCSFKGDLLWKVSVKQSVWSSEGGEGGVTLTAARRKVVTGQEYNSRDCWSRISTEEVTQHWKCILCSFKKRKCRTLREQQQLSQGITGHCFGKESGCIQLLSSSACLTTCSAECNHTSFRAKQLWFRDLLFSTQRISRFTFVAYQHRH